MFGVQQTLEIPDGYFNRKKQLSTKEQSLGSCKPILSLVRVCPFEVGVPRKKELNYKVSVYSGENV